MWEATAEIKLKITAGIVKIVAVETAEKRDSEILYMKS